MRSGAGSFLLIALTLAVLVGKGGVYVLVLDAASHALLLELGRGVLALLVGFVAFL